MSATTTVTGNLGQDPQLRFTSDGTPVLGISIAATHSQKDKQSGQWGDVGEPLWIRASFWKEEAEHLAQILHKGGRVTVEGTLIRKVWNSPNGQGGENLELHYPRFLGVVPRRQSNTYDQIPQPAGGFNNTVSGYDSAPAGGQASDPWAQQGAMDAPF